MQFFSTSPIVNNKINSDFPDCNTEKTDNSDFNTQKEEKYKTAHSSQIPDRQPTEMGIQESELYYRYIVETASEGIWIFDTDNKITFANNRIAEMLGYKVEEMYGRLLFQFMDSESAGIARNYIERRRQGIKERHDFKFTRKDGSDLWVIVSATPMFNSEGEYTGVLRMITDISDLYNQLQLRKKAESELRNTLKELEYEKFALDQSAIVAITDAKGVITYVNDQFCDISKYNRNELIGKTHKIINSSYHPFTFFQTLWSTIKAGNIWRGEIKNKAKDGSYYWVDTTIVPFLNSSGEPYQYVAIRKNITDRKQIEEALRQSESQLKARNEEIAKALRDLQQTQSLMVQNEKMVSLGQLVAGVAHEINNPVSFIYGNVMHAETYFQDLVKMLEIYQQEYPNPTSAVKDGIDDVDLKFLLKDLPRLLKSMKIGAERIHQIVLSLKNFSRLDETGQKQVDIHEGLESTLLILQHRFKETAGHPRIFLIKEYGKLPKFQCYPGQLNQVFMNIIGNSLDALEEAMENGNWIAKDMSSLNYCPSPTIKINTEFIEGKGLEDRIVIRISDNGPGIPIEVQKRLFDPFFTTKNPGKGTGLGLSISYKIVVEKHGGKLTCISIPSQGAEFVIEIPVAKNNKVG
jgi:PAS domain S-box-containing protein